MRNKRRQSAAKAPPYREIHERPSIGTSNAEELLFDRIDSGYLVTVATLEGAGRSATAQCLHASEVAFWPDLPTQFASLMQTVPDMGGTEVILESTANRYNDFHKLWRKAEAGESEFLPVFLPWSLAPEYRAKVGDDFKLTAGEKELRLDAEQIAWRRLKISQLGTEELFAQEYPLYAAEAFIASAFDSFIPADLVLRARREEIEADGPLVIGVDPAGMGADATAIAWRQGSAIPKSRSAGIWTRCRYAVGSSPSSTKTSPRASTSTCPAWVSGSTIDYGSRGTTSCRPSISVASRLIRAFLTRPAASAAVLRIGGPRSG